MKRKIGKISLYDFYDCRMIKMLIVEDIEIPKAASCQMMTISPKQAEDEMAGQLDPFPMVFPKIYFLERWWS